MKRRRMEIRVELTPDPIDLVAWAAVYVRAVLALEGIVSASESTPPTRMAEAS